MLYSVLANPVGRDRCDGVRFIDGEVDWFPIDGAAAGGVNDLLHPVINATLDETDRADDVVLRVENRFGVGSTDIVLRRMVVDNIGFLTLKNFVKRRIQERGFVKFCSWVEVVSVSSSQVVDDNHFVSELDQRVDQM